MSLKKHCIKGGELAWLHFNTKLGQSQCGDYAYQQAYAKNRSEKKEDGETYIKVRIVDVMSKYGKLTFNLLTVCKDGKEVYNTQCDDHNRLTLITE